MATMKGQQVTFFRGTHCIIAEQLDVHYRVQMIESFFYRYVAADSIPDDFLSFLTLILH